MKRVFFLGHILVPLGLGGLGYLLLGGDTYFSSWLYRCLGVSRPDLGCPAFLRSYLLDMLWAYGLTAAVVWVMERPGVVFGICCAVEVGVECLQGLGIFSGTFEIFSKAYISTQLSDAIVFGVLIVVLLIKPAGLLGKKISEKV